MLNQEFKKFFEKSIEEFYNIFFDEVPEDTFSRKSKSMLLTEILEKLEFGLNKYEDVSFQANEENLISVDVLSHLKEEMVDAVNYILSQKIKDEFLIESEFEEGFHENIFKMLIIIISMIEKRKTLV